MISGLQLGGGCVELGGLAEEEAVGQGTTDAVVEEGEHQGDADTFVGQSVGITVAVAWSKAWALSLRRS